jgi:hypothetical protein
MNRAFVSVWLGGVICESVRHGRPLLIERHGILGPPVLLSIFGLSRRRPMFDLLESAGTHCI